MTVSLGKIIIKNVQRCLNDWLTAKQLRKKESRNSILILNHEFFSLHQIILLQMPISIFVQSSDEEPEKKYRDGMTKLKYHERSFYSRSWGIIPKIDQQWCKKEGTCMPKGLETSKNTVEIWCKCRWTTGAKRKNVYPVRRQDDLNPDLGNERVRTLREALNTRVSLTSGH